MFTIYYSNHLNAHKDKFINLLTENYEQNPFKSEKILVQSIGIGKWLEKEVAKNIGISANLDFIFPTKFLSQLYQSLYSTPYQDDPLSHTQITWRLMKILPEYLSIPNNILAKYFSKHSSQTALYQLSKKIADVFTQYLFFRQDWILNINQNFGLENSNHIKEMIEWQSKLFQLLIIDLEKDFALNILDSHFLFLNNYKNLFNLQNCLPKRLFIFGISAIPTNQLAILKELSKYTDIYLFMISPSDKDWWNDINDNLYDKLLLAEKITALESLESNTLVNIWGLQGKNTFIDFLDQDINISDEVYFQDYPQDNILSKIKESMLELTNDYTIDNIDNSIQIHACYSEMREVEILYDNILTFFKEDKSLTLNDIIIMSPDINKYIPYIHAVFSKKSNQFIPYTISDKIDSKFNPIITSLLSLLNSKNLSTLNVEFILDLIQVEAIFTKFNLDSETVNIIVNWVSQLNTYYGDKINYEFWSNYNSWENGLSKLLLGGAFKEEYGIWQDTIAFTNSYNLNAEVAGLFSYFIECILEIKNRLEQKHTIEDWLSILINLIDQFYEVNSVIIAEIEHIKNVIYEIYNEVITANYNELLDFEIIYNILNSKLNQNSNSVGFLSGKLNFCTLLPMRSIPFKIICLLGMNEESFPRTDHPDEFNLMTYFPRKGDRSKRDDDLYLFLETLLSAENIFYISYVGYSLSSEQERLPSIVVSQLIDFIALGSNEFKVISHSMSNHSEFLDINMEKRDSLFLNSFNYEENKNIDLDDLISYISSPIKFIFNHFLGISFDDNTTELLNSEKFDLNNLDKYKLNLEIISNEDNNDVLLSKEKLKGSIPAAHFSDIIFSEISDGISPLKQTIKPYVSSELLAKRFNLTLDEFNLSGEINHIYDDKVIMWKVSSLKDKDIIKCWIYHLIFTLLEINYPITFYYKSGKSVGKLSFNDIDKATAKQQLMLYLKDYSQLSFAISYTIEDYFKNIAENIMDDSLIFLNKLINEKSYSDALYLERILEDKLDYEAIYHKTHLWFDKMLEYKQEEKLKV